VKSAQHDQTSEVSIHMKGRSERVFIVNVMVYACLSKACTFMCIWGLNAVQTIPFVFVVLSSMPSTFGMRDGWLILDRVIDMPVYQDILTWNGLSQVIEMRSRFSGLFKSRTLWCSQC
jgi:hypothetical protein